MPAPSIDPDGGTSPGDYVATPDIGKVNYEPTRDDELEKAADVEPQGGSGGKGTEIGPVNPSEIGGSVIDIPTPEPKSNDGFVPYDTEPVLISIEPPVYPEMVRDAGIDGTVFVRVFIALNGHVKDARVVDGSPALREAALASARTAFFKAAMQGTHPVEVWVVIPITFELRERY
jgi:protein TonB